jgi:glutamyl-tRNA reductase
MTPLALAAAVFEDLRRARVLCVGTATSITDVARDFGVCGSVEHTVRVPEALERFDIIVTSVGARKPILAADRLRTALRARRRRPMVVVELSPGDVAHEVARLEDVFLMTSQEAA